MNDDFILGLDFKSTNNNLEFGGANVQASAAELFQIRIGNDYLRRGNCDQYERLQSDLFIGPGDGFSSNNTTQAFSTIRPNTSPDYMYGRVRYESATNVGDSNDWQLTLRATGQLASERVLFSEMLGFGGYDTIRGYDQRALSGDHGWLTSVELGTRPADICVCDRPGRLRYYSFLDMGKAYIQNPLPGQLNNLFLSSVGVGMQMSVGEDLSLRLDYGYGFEEVPGQPNDRLHLGVVWQFGPRPQ